jgi:hypothetical protein
MDGKINGEVLHQGLKSLSPQIPENLREPEDKPEKRGTIEKPVS